MAEIFYIEKCYRIADDENIEELISEPCDGLKVADYKVYQASTDETQKCIKLYYLRE